MLPSTVTIAQQKKAIFLGRLEWNNSGSGQRGNLIFDARTAVCTGYFNSGAVVRQDAVGSN